MVATTVDRVRMSTSDEVNERIRRQTDANVARFAALGREAIDRRLRELDREWDIERVLETGSSALTLTGLLLGIAVNRKWLLLSLVVQGFFMQHALQGWCPPLPLFRRLGVRTQPEIERERHALKALRGDFNDASDAPSALEAVRV